MKKLWIMVILGTALVNLAKPAEEKNLGTFQDHKLKFMECSKHVDGKRLYLWLLFKNNNGRPLAKFKGLVKMADIKTRKAAIFNFDDEEPDNGGGTKVVQLEGWTYVSMDREGIRDSSSKNLRIESVLIEELTFE